MSTAIFEALPERRAEATARVTALRRERGERLADGLSFDGAALAEAEATLQALSDAEGVVVERQRAAAAREEQRRRERLRGELVAAEEDRLAAIQRAEIAAKE